MRPDGQDQLPQRGQQRQAGGEEAGSLLHGVLVLLLCTGVLAGLFALLAPLALLVFVPPVAVALLAVMSPPAAAADGSGEKRHFRDRLEQRYQAGEGKASATAESHVTAPSSFLLRPLSHLRRLCVVSSPARGLVPPLLFVSVPPLSVSFLLLAAGSVTMAFPVGALLVLAIAIPFFITAWAEKQKRFNIEIIRTLRQHRSLKNNFGHI